MEELEVLTDYEILEVMEYIPYTPSKAVQDAYEENKANS